jgi:hypothetical protein
MYINGNGTTYTVTSLSGGTVGVTPNISANVSSGTIVTFGSQVEEFSIIVQGTGELIENCTTHNYASGAAATNANSYTNGVNIVGPGTIRHCYDDGANHSFGAFNVVDCSNTQNSNIFWYDDTGDASNTHITDCQIYYAQIGIQLNSNATCTGMQINGNDFYAYPTSGYTICSTGMPATSSTVTTVSGSQAITFASPAGIIADPTATISCTGIPAGDYLTQYNVATGQGTLNVAATANSSTNTAVVNEYRYHIGIHNNHVYNMSGSTGGSEVFLFEQSGVVYDDISGNHVDPTMSFGTGWDGSSNNVGFNWKGSTSYSPAADLRYVLNSSLGTGVSAALGNSTNTSGGLVTQSGGDGRYVPQTTTVNGHALSANVTVSASDLTTGTLPFAQVPSGNTTSTVAPGAGSTVYASLASPTFTGTVTVPGLTDSTTANHGNMLYENSSGVVSPVTLSTSASSSTASFTGGTLSIPQQKPSNMSGLGTGVATAMGNNTQGASGFAVYDSSGNLDSNGNVNVPSSSAIYWSGSSAFFAPSNGVIKMTNTSQTGFSALDFFTDTGISRLAADSFGFGNGTTGDTSAALSANSLTLNDGGLTNPGTISDTQNSTTDAIVLSANTTASFGSQYPNIEFGLGSTSGSAGGDVLVSAATLSGSIGDNILFMKPMSSSYDAGILSSGVPLVLGTYGAAKPIYFDIDVFGTGIATSTGVLAVEISPNRNLLVGGATDVTGPGNIVSDVVGAGLQVKEGTNAKQGTFTFSSGVATVSNTSVTANSRIFISMDGGVNGSTAIGEPTVTARTAGTGFTVASLNSSGATTTGDTRIGSYEIFEPAP